MLRNASDLKDQLLSAVRESQAQQFLDDPTESVRKKTKALLTMHGGVAAQVSAYIWIDGRLSPFERSLAAQFWANRVWTLVRQQMLFGAGVITDATCPRCHQGVETVDYIANKCNLPAF